MQLIPWGTVLHETTKICSSLFSYGHELFTLSLLLVMTDPFKVYYDTLACQRCWRLAITDSSQYPSFINHAVFHLPPGLTEHQRMIKQCGQKRSSLMQEVHTCITKSRTRKCFQWSDGNTCNGVLVHRPIKPVLCFYLAIVQPRI